MFWVRWEHSASEDNLLTVLFIHRDMPIIYHLRLSAAAKRAGSTDRRVYGIRRRPSPKVVVTPLLPASPCGEPEMVATPTPRPSVVIDAPRIERPRHVFVPDIDYDAFGGMSPGFCPTGSCRCGDCGYSRDRDRGSRYTSEDYERDCAEAEEETEEEANARITKELAAMMKEFAVSTNEEKIALIIPLAEYILDDPGMWAFLTTYPGFAAVVRDRMLDFSHKLPGTQQERLCREVLRTFF